MSVESMSVEEPDEVCETCRFFVKNHPTDEDPDGHGKCHRYPPTAIYHEEESDFNWTMMIRPGVFSDDFCGEWRP